MARQHGSRAVVAAQLPLFPERASLVRIRPERNEWRFYRLEIWPDLFGRVLLMRQWGRIGTEGRRRLDPYPDTGAALNALATITRAPNAAVGMARVHRPNRVRVSDQRFPDRPRHHRNLVWVGSGLRPGSRVRAWRTSSLCDGHVHSSALGRVIGGPKP